MQVTVHLRDGGEPVTGATVRVLLEAPTQGLGEALVKYSASYRPVPFDSPDPPAGRG